MKRKSLVVIGLSVLLSVFIFVGVARAQTVKSSDHVTVSKGQTVDSILFATGKTIVIDGTINGDLFCAGQSVSISGTINGDVFCAAQTLRITGIVDGSVRAVGQSVTYSADTTGSVSLTGQVVTLEENAIVGRDLLVGASSMLLQGTVIRDASIGAESATINGEIGRNLGGRYEKLTLGPSANVKGSVDYTSSADLSKSAGATVDGTVNRRNPPKKQNSNPISQFNLLGLFVYMFVALMIVSLTTVLLFPKLFTSTNSQISNSKSRVIAIGLTMLFVAPIVLFLIGLSIVGLPLAGLALAAWLISLMLSGPVAAYFVGSKVIRGSHSPFIVMLTGSAIVLALYVIPGINILVGFFVGVVGSGALVSSAFGMNVTKSKVATKSK